MRFLKVKDCFGLDQHSCTKVSVQLLSEKAEMFPDY